MGILDSVSSFIQNSFGKNKLPYDNTINYKSVETDDISTSVVDLTDTTIIASSDPRSYIPLPVHSNKYEK
ncbi:hypothetical protein DLAC_11359 [Tieghemostelium lacteum]|uniref:Uncharacterized protein n=1 Tax=Tieghemostelium lacteum TaxID=361077 RepID=A0A151Z3S8_TIELA|nr:hypothetical protein DLAC_11359 [Tieghemostelium lacteum]|eukprot:KYQ88616.1 hypothetical protein DLAC_11359 [Tieghemostelium lacteum]